MFPPIFVADTKIIYGYNFVAPLRKEVEEQNKSLECENRALEQLVEF